MKTSETIDLIAKALAEAQKTIHNPAHNRKCSAGTAGIYTYADLSSLHDMLRKPLADQGLSYVQSAAIDRGMLITRLMHQSGQWIEFEFPCACWSFTDAKKLGGWLTYMRRYSLGSIFQVHGEEDQDATVDGKPLIADAKKAQEPKKAEPTKSEIAPEPDFSPEMISDWKEQFGFVEGSDIFLYASRIAEHRKVPLDSMIPAFMKNEDSFVKGFNDWNLKRKASA